MLLHVCDTLQDRYEDRDALIAAVPLAVLDAAICWWIFSSLTEVMRTLRLRRNVVKLTLYRHLMNALIFNVIGMCCIVWSKV